jgi:transposase InsO family protein
MYKFITEDRAEAGAAEPPAVQTYCHALGVSMSGYRKHCRQQSTVSQREIAQAMLDLLIRQIYAHHKGRYGYARITAELKRRGIPIDRKRVLKRMQAMNLHARTHRPFKKTTCRDKRHIASPNLLKQRFYHDRIREYFVTDVTYIDTDEGFVYLSIVLDLATREVVGWSISETLEQPGIVRAIERMIVGSRPAPGAMLHSDRGSQYTASITRELLKAHGIIQSMSSTGNCYDNAVAESYFKTIKNEEVYWKHYRTRDEVRTSIVDYIDYYNNERLHSTIGFITPSECRELKLRNQQSITNHPIEATLLKG